jgi:hypothetical protein
MGEITAQVSGRGGEQNHVIGGELYALWKAARGMILGPGKDRMSFIFLEDNAFAPGMSHSDPSPSNRQVINLGRSGVIYCRMEMLHV